VYLDLWLLARVRQPLPVDEFEKNHRFTFRQLSRVLGGQSADYPRPGPPTLSRVYALPDTGQAAFDVHRNLHQGKVGVLCLAPEAGLGVRDGELRARHIHDINRFREDA
jgi:crotonyl-CoA reductase